MTTTIYQNTQGVECVQITNKDGSQSSMLKSAYGEQQAQAVMTP